MYWKIVLNKDIVESLSLRKKRILSSHDLPVWLQVSKKQWETSNEYPQLLHSFLIDLKFINFIDLILFLFNFSTKFSLK